MARGHRPVVPVEDIPSGMFFDPPLSLSLTFYPGELLASTHRRSSSCGGHLARALVVAQPGDYPR